MNRAHPSTGEPGAAGSSASRPGHPDLLRVLVIDHDARVRDAIRETIALEADMQLVGESDAAGAALTMARDTDPFVALVDVGLPDLVSGLELVQQLSEMPSVSVVAMSVRIAVRTAALAAGARYFIEKGGDIDELLATVRAAARPITGRTTAEPFDSTAGQ